MRPRPCVNIMCHVESRGETGGGGATCVHVEGLQVIYELYVPRDVLYDEVRLCP